jgi:hypothetical protein
VESNPARYQRRVGQLGQTRAHRQRTGEGVREMTERKMNRCRDAKGPPILHHACGFGSPDFDIPS